MSPTLSSRPLVALSFAAAAGLAPAALAQDTGELQARVQYQNRDGAYFDCDQYRMFFKVNGVLAGFVEPAAGTFAGFRTNVAPQRGMLNWKVTPYAYASGIARVADAAGVTHNYTVNASYPVNTAAQLTIQTVNSNVTGQAFEVLRPIVAQNKFFAGLGATLPFTDIRLDSTLRGSFYNNTAQPSIRIDPSDVHSLDVIMHEYGHMVGFKNGMSTARAGGVPGDHHFGADNIRGGASAAFGGSFSAKGRRDGSRYGYSEGVATFLGNMAKMEGNVAATGWPARDCVPQYFQLNAAGNTGLWSVDLETRSTWDATRPGGSRFQNVVGLGEGDELSVCRALWDFYDGHGASGGTNEGLARGRNDRVNYAAQRTWNNILGSTSTFAGAWTNLANDLGTAAGRGRVSGRTTNTQAEAVAAAGETLEESGIAFLPLTSGAVGQRPTLQWTEQNNNNSWYFRTLIFDAAWTLAYDSGLRNDPRSNSFGNESFTITRNLDAGNYNWVILNDPALLGRVDLAGNNQLYNWFWSGANPLTVSVPAPGTFALLAAAGLVAVRRRRV